MWNKSSRVLFHGTNSEAADKIISAASGSKAPSGVDLTLCNSKTDFGRGFYTTSNRVQAISWANYRHDPTASPAPSNRAAVLSFEIKWDDIAKLAHVGFSWEGADSTSSYWTFVTHCRGGNDHNRQGGDY
jgi:hypothetical protein